MFYDTGKIVLPTRNCVVWITVEQYFASFEDLEGIDSRLSA